MVGASIFFAWLFGLELGLILLPFTCKCKEGRYIWKPEDDLWDAEVLAEVRMSLRRYCRVGSKTRRC